MDNKTDVMEDIKMDNLTGAKAINISGTMLAKFCCAIGLVVVAFKIMSNVVKDIQTQIDEN